MNLIYLSYANLKDRLFVRDFVSSFKFSTPTLVFHDKFGDTSEDAIFVTKRISALLSECLVHNHAFSASQRDFFFWEDGILKANSLKIQKLLSPIPVLILSPVVKQDGKETLTEALDMVLVAKSIFDIPHITVFTDNALSPLASGKNIVRNQEDMEALLKLYEEERESIHRAFLLRPSKICGVRNYSL